jgi:hypothetical protein
MKMGKKAKSIKVVISATQLKRLERITGVTTSRFFSELSNHVITSPPLIKRNNKYYTKLTDEYLYEIRNITSGNYREQGKQKRIGKVVIYSFDPTEPPIKPKK